jgi:acyl-CoA thioesterase FadM
MGGGSGQRYGHEVDAGGVVSCARYSETMEDITPRITALEANFSHVKEYL